MKLAPGLHTVNLPAVRLPADVTGLSFAPSEPGGGASVLSLRFSDEPRTAADSAAITGIMALNITTQATDALDISLEFASPDPRGGTVTAALELYRIDPNSGLSPFGYWELAQAATVRHGSSRFHLDLASLLCEGGREDSQAPPTLRSGPLPDGRYAAHLALYHMEDGVARWPWVSFRVEAGRAFIERATPPPQVAIVYLPEPREMVTLRSHIPEGAGVLVVPDPDPDRGFITAAAGFLNDRGVAADLPLPRSGLHPAEPGRIYDFVLLPNGADPGDYGYEAAGLVWSNRFARLYERTAGAPAALFRFPNGLDLAAGQTLRVGLAPGGSRLDLPDGSSEWGGSSPGAAADVEMVLVNPASQMVQTGALSDSASATPQGVMRERLAAQPQPSNVTLRAADGQITVASVRITAPSGVPSGRTALEGVVAVRTGEARVKASAAALPFEATGIADPPTVAGLDVYSRGQCAVNHFGYWALALPGGASDLDFTLDAAKKGAFSAADGAPLPVDAQTWPTGDGLYRAMLFVREGEVTRMTPAFRFRLSGGRLSDVESLAPSRLLLLRRLPPAP
ncbi:MAG: hypothetical protein NTZ05_02980 [Chloroflexi bacterium]|nr:hypothetical protein [Chloroflexota bacterium]